MTTPDELIYQARQALERSQQQVDQSTRNALRNARLRAVSRAEEKFSSRASVPSRWRLSSGQAWGMGLSFASLVTVVVGLQIAQTDAIEQDILRIAEIDKRMISGPLPPKAYLDPGFLAYQEETLNAEQVVGLTAGITIHATTVAAAGATSAGLRQYWNAGRFFPGLESGPQKYQWAKLTNPQRDALAPLEAYWPELDEARKRKWVKIADRFHLLSDAERALAQERMEAWVALPAVERRQARAVYDGVRDTIPEHVRAMKWNEYQKLSEKERTRLFELAQQKVAEASATSDATAVRTARPHSALAPRAEKPLSAQ